MAQDNNLLGIGDTLAGRYYINGKLGSGGMGAVYSAIPFDDPSRRVAIKIIYRPNSFTTDDIRRFQKEAELMSQLHHPNIICFQELGLLGLDKSKASVVRDANQLSGGFYIVMELADGIDLKKYLGEHGRCEVALFIQLATQVASALDYTHGKNIIHMDIKPQNIVVGQNFSEQQQVVVKVLDFGISRLQDRKLYEAEVSGTPMYMAPEQTPYVDSAIDHRADLYALGCVLYEMLAGRPPFVEKNREKLMSRHAQVPPEPLLSIRPDIPQVIAGIVMRLLAKNPDDRYQTAFSLLADLKKAETWGARRPFALGGLNKFRSVSAQLPLIGREGELQELMAIKSRLESPHGRKHIAVVRGGPGVGKSRVLNELRQNLISGGASYVHCVFSRYTSNLPFNSLANGFNDYLWHLQKHQPEEAAEFGRRLKDKLGRHAFEVASVIPGLGSYLDGSNVGPSAVSDYIEQDQTEFEQQKAENFAKYFADFVSCLTHETRLLTMIFDDIHWADESSLDLVERVFQEQDQQRLLLILGVRSGGASYPNSLLENFLKKFSSKKSRMSVIELRPLNLTEVDQLGKSVLASPYALEEELLEDLGRMSSGNPLQVVESIRAMVTHDLIGLKGIQKRWRWTSSKRHFPIQYIDLMINRFQSYDEDTRSVVEVAAVLGMSFYYDLLCLCLLMTPMRIQTALQRAINEGFLIRSSGDPEMSKFGKCYSFIHPTARDAMCLGVPEHRTRRIHERIAVFLVGNLEDIGAKENLLYRVVHHVNAALKGAQTPSSTLHHLGLTHNVMAGRVAMSKNSWLQARGYLETAQQLAGMSAAQHPFVKEERYEGGALRTICELLGDTEWYLDNPEQAARYYQQVIGKEGEHLPQHLGALNKLSGILSYGGKVNRAFSYTLRGLRSVGIKIRRPGSLFWWVSFWPFFKDALISPRQLRRWQRRILRHSEGLNETLNQSGIGALHQGHVIARFADPRWSLKLLSFSRRRMMIHCDSSDKPTVLRLLGDCSFVLGSLGKLTQAYDSVDELIGRSLVLNSKDALGYLTLYKILILDAYSGKYEIMEKKIRHALGHLTKREDRTHYAYGRLYLLYFDLMRGNIQRIGRAAEFLSGPELPYRNQLNCRGFCIYTYSLLVADRLEDLVRDAGLYLKRLASVQQPPSLFSYLIESMLALAKGEARKAKENFDLCLQIVFSGGLSFPKQFLLPFELDFLGLVISSYNDIFHRLYSRPLYGVAKAKKVHRVLLKHALHRNNCKRSIWTVIRARCMWVLGDGSYRAVASQAMQSAMGREDFLAAFWGYYWFGWALARDAAQSSKPSHEVAMRVPFSSNILSLEYIQKAMSIAQRRGFEHLVNLAKHRLGQLRNHLRNDQASYQDLALVADAPQLPEVRPALPELASDNLQLILEGMDQTAREEVLSQCLHLLRAYTNCQRLWLFSQGQDERLVFECCLGNDDNQRLEVGEYLAPYGNLRSALFLPSADCGWLLADAFTEQASAAEEATEHSATLVTGEPGVEGTISSSPRRDSHMNLILPLAVAGLKQPPGMVFAEAVNIGLQFQEDTRAALEYFCSQAGLLHHQSIPDIYSTMNGEVFYLEPCEWLQISHGGKGGEVVAGQGYARPLFLGLNLGGDHYLCFYVRLKGGYEVVENHLLAILIHVLSLRAMITVSQGVTSAISEIKEEFNKLLGSLNRIKLLSDMVMSFSVIQRLQGVVHSGHFGRSRPQVWGSENRVYPDNQTEWELAGGRSIRFWGVRAPFGPSEIFFVCHEASRLAAFGLPAKPPPQEEEPQQLLAAALEKQLLAHQIPSYYIAAQAKEDAVTYPTLPQQLTS